MGADGHWTRRRLLGTGAAGALSLSPAGRAAMALARSGGRPGLRKPDSLPDPGRPAGTPTSALPFDHIVVLMMENHSFDCYFGMLPRRGQPDADGYRFDVFGQPDNVNPYHGGYVKPFRATSECQPSVGQSWNSTHQQINGGRMNGFARNSPGSMVYWTDEDLPFYYSLASEFTLANRWFGSAPCQTYPNRRFLLAGTAFGLISTDVNSITNATPPPNGTLFDRLNAHGIAWKNYFVDLPAVGVIPSALENHPQALAPIAQFYVDCALGTLPPVSFVDPEFGLAGEVGGPLSSGLPDSLKALGTTINAQGGDEENPQDIQIGENYAAKVVNAVLSSPAWSRTLLVWTYDEHGGYYDHVPPPAAVKPDDIPPELGPDDVPGAYDIYGPRVPAVVVSPYCRPKSVSSTVCDHTSIMATIEAKWNLPACTYRDANANTLASFLTEKPHLLDPPALSAPSDPLPGEANCSDDEPQLPVVGRYRRRHRRLPRYG
jgi:phospholipase C